MNDILANAAAKAAAISTGTTTMTNTTTTKTVSVMDICKTNMMGVPKYRILINKELGERFWEDESHLLVGIADIEFSEIGVSKLDNTSRNLSISFKMVGIKDKFTVFASEVMKGDNRIATLPWDTGLRKAVVKRDKAGNVVYRTNPDGSLILDSHGNKKPDTTWFKQFDLEDIVVAYLAMAAEVVFANH